MSRLFEEMAQGTAEARAYMEGVRTGYKVTPPELQRRKAKGTSAP